MKIDSKQIRVMKLAVGEEKLVDIVRYLPSLGTSHPRETRYGLGAFPVVDDGIFPVFYKEKM